MAHPTLISDHVGTNPIITSERHAQHSHLTTNVRKAQHLHSTMRGSNPPCQKGSALTYDHCRNQSYNRLRMDLHLHLTTNVRKAQHLHSTMRGTNPPCRKGSALTSDNQCQKGPAFTFNHVRNQSSMPKRICTYI